MGIFVSARVTRFFNTKFVSLAVARTARFRLFCRARRSLECGERGEYWEIGVHEVMDI